MPRVKVEDWLNVQQGSLLNEEEATFQLGSVVQGASSEGKWVAKERVCLCWQGTGPVKSRHTLRD